LNEWYAIGHGYYSWQKGTILQQKGKHWPWKRLWSSFNRS
jgi:hypothetical protein